jgi:hypothetical protein
MSFTTIMRTLKVFRVFFALTALLFVVKPFMGFGAFNQQAKPHLSHSLLVKSFTKRKPESLEEAEAHVQAVHHQLTNPPLPLLSAIALLLAILLPLLPEKLTKLTGQSLSDLKTALFPPEQVYLLTGRLII